MGYILDDRETAPDYQPDVTEEVRRLAELPEAERKQAMEAEFDRVWREAELKPE
jgi:hypothetical protein